MRALMIREFGKAAAVLECGEQRVRDVAEGELLVKMLASPIHPADLNWIEGTYGTRPTLPEVPGTEAVGEVVASRSMRFPVGTRVMFLGYAHGWQEQRVVAEAELLALPDDIAVTELALLKVNPATAWRMLHDFVALPAGSVIVQNAANSGVGRCVTQIARCMGVRTIAMVRRAELSGDLQDLGADLVCMDDESGKQEALDFLQAHGQKAAMALNAVGGESALRQFDLLADGATQVTYGAMGRRPVTVPNKFLIFRDIRVRGFWLSLWLKQATRDAVEAMYGDLIAMMRAGTLRQEVDGIFALEDFAQALERVEAADRRGKVLFSCGN